MNPAQYSHQPSGLKPWWVFKIDMGGGDSIAEAGAFSSIEAAEQGKKATLDLIQKAEIATTYKVIEGIVMAPSYDEAMRKLFEDQSFIPMGNA